MLVLQYTFTRPNTSVNFYSATGDASVVSAINTAVESGDIVLMNSNVSQNNLVMTKNIGFPNEAALTRVSSNSVLATNKQTRTTYNNANGITESVAQGTV